MGDDPAFVDIVILPLYKGEDVTSQKIQDGKIIVTGKLDKLVGVSLLKHDYTQEILNGKEYYVGEAYYSHGTDKAMLPIAAAVYDNANKLIGAVVIGVYLTYFTTNYVEGFSTSDDSYVLTRLYQHKVHK